jgi:hypothetical protein
MAIGVLRKEWVAQFLRFPFNSGYVGGKAADSDKGAGVVALTMFDLRRRNKVNRVGMCGVNVSVLFHRPLCYAVAAVLKVLYFQS